jgi:hypothetical protein
MLDKIGAQAQKYDAAVDKVVQSMDNRHSLATVVLDVQGSKALKAIENINTKAYVETDSLTQQHASNAEKAIIQLQLDAYKYLESGNEDLAKTYYSSQSSTEKTDRPGAHQRVRRQLAQDGQRGPGRHPGLR